MVVRILERIYYKSPCLENFVFQVAFLINFYQIYFQFSKSFHYFTTYFIHFHAIFSLFFKLSSLSCSQKHPLIIKNCRINFVIFLDYFTNSSSKGSFRPLGESSWLFIKVLARTYLFLKGEDSALSSFFTELQFLLFKSFSLRFI